MIKVWLKFGIQKKANSQFGKFIERNYGGIGMLQKDKPVQSHTLFKIGASRTQERTPILFVVIDNLRYDQWKTFESVVGNYYKLEKEVPTTLFFLRRRNMRNAIFSGLTPLEMENSSQYWKNDPKKEVKN
jgi:hypothetical protein